MSKHVGSTLDSFLEEIGEREEVVLRAQKKVLATEVRERMRELHLGKAALARRMRTSRSQVDRLLDPGNTSVTIASLARVSAALGLRLRFGLAPGRRLPVRHTREGQSAASAR